MTPSHRRFAALAASLAAPLLVLAGLLLGLPSPAQAANAVVHTCTPAGLKAAIAAAGAGGLVTFDCTSGGPTIVLTQAQTISQGVTIDGGGVITLSGGDNARIFNVPDSQKATLLNLTLAHGHSSLGGALSVTGRAVITNVTFVRNSSSGTGGAIAVNNLGRAEVYLSRFYTNTATSGGAIVSAGSLGVDRSDFSGNSAEFGGAIQQPGGIASVVGSSFISNTGEFGGALHTQASLGLLGDEFDHNSTPLVIIPFGFRGGGALYVTSGATAVVRQTTFFSNSANTGSVVGVGGAIINEGFLSMTDSLLNQNLALEDGGAIFNDSLMIMDRGTLARNSALGEGGAISNTGQTILYHTNLVSNTAGVSGGAIANAGETAGLEFGLLVNNRAPNGGAVRNHTGSEATIFNSTIENNAASTGAGGGILNNGLLVAFNDTWIANQAAASGGAIQSSGVDTPEVTLVSSTIVSNTAASAGAALRHLSGKFTLINNIVAFNSPDNCQGGGFTQAGPNLQFGSLSCGGTITNADPRLGPLQDNGGPRIGVFNVALLTLQPRRDSPAIDGGDNAYCGLLQTDERGFLRAPPCDLGAVEGILKLWLPVSRK